MSWQHTANGAAPLNLAGTRTTVEVHDDICPRLKSTLQASRNSFSTARAVAVVATRSNRRQQSGEDDGLSQFPAMARRKKKTTACVETLQVARHG